MLNGNLLSERRYRRRNLYHILDNFIIYPLQVIWVQSVHYFSWLEGFTEWHHNSLNARFWLFTKVNFIFNAKRWKICRIWKFSSYYGWIILFFLYAYVKSCKNGFIINGDHHDKHDIFNKIKRKQRLVATSDAIRFQGYVVFWRLRALKWLICGWHAQIWQGKQH